MFADDTNRFKSVCVCAELRQRPNSATLPSTDFLLMWSGSRTLLNLTDKKKNKRKCFASRRAAMHSQGICPAALLAGPRQIWFCSSLPFSPAVSRCNKSREKTPLGSVNTVLWQGREKKKPHVSTWFSKERMTGYWEVLNALSAMASITSCRGTETRRTLSFSCHRRYEQQTQMSETKLAAVQPGSNAEVCPQRDFQPRATKRRQRDEVQSPLDSAETLKTFPERSHLGTDSKPK